MSKESKFLHDISSPITVLQIHLESAMTLVATADPESLREVEDILKNSLKQIEIAIKLIGERRSEIQTEVANE
jgi:hypothetical protein